MSIRRTVEGDMARVRAGMERMNGRWEMRAGMGRMNGRWEMSVGREMCEKAQAGTWMIKGTEKGGLEKRKAVESGLIRENKGE